MRELFQRLTHRAELRWEERWLGYDNPSITPASLFSRGRRNFAYPPEVDETGSPARPRREPAAARKWPRRLATSPQLLFVAMALGILPGYLNDKRISEDGAHLVAIILSLLASFITLVWLLLSVKIRRLRSHDDISGLFRTESSVQELIAGERLSHFHPYVLTGTAAVAVSLSMMDVHAGEVLFSAVSTELTALCCGVIASTFQLAWILATVMDEAAKSRMKFEHMRTDVRLYLHNRNRNRRRDRDTELRHDSD